MLLRPEPMVPLDLLRLETVQDRFLCVRRKFVEPFRWRKLNVRRREKYVYLSIYRRRRHYGLAWKPFCVIGIRQNSDAELELGRLLHLAHGAGEIASDSTEISGDCFRRGVRRQSNPVPGSRDGPGGNQEY